MRFKSRLAAAVARHRRSPFLAWGARASRWYTRAYNNFDYELQTNGEGWLIARVAEAGGTLYFDVGANVGEWSRRVCAATPLARVHAFEIVPTTAEALQRRVADLPVTVNCIGLLDSSRVVRVTHYPQFTPTSTVFAYPKHPGPTMIVDCPTTTGDEYCRATGIDWIDFLKIDTEGADHLVIQGFNDMLSKSAIRIIQFEYGRTAIGTHFLLADFHAMFEQYGYTVGRLYPSHVDFGEYEPEHENFLGPNFVALRQHDRVLRAILG
jgi:FkbM family methyltransferase